MIPFDLFGDLRALLSADVDGMRESWRFLVFWPCFVCFPGCSANGCWPLAALIVRKRCLWTEGMVGTASIYTVANCLPHQIQLE